MAYFSQVGAYVAHGDLFCLDDFERLCSPSSQLTWVMMSTNIVHTLMSDEPFQNYSTFTIIGPLFNFDLSMREPHILQNEKNIICLSFQDHLWSKPLPVQRDPHSGKPQVDFGYSRPSFNYSILRISVS